MAMRPENKAMQEFLKQNGLTVNAKWLADGSLKRCWRLWGRDQKWTPELADKLNGLGFRNFDNKPLDIYSGNGGTFQVFVRGHEELLDV